MPRVLMIAYYFPPLGGIGSIREARFAEHLPEFGWDPLVLAPRHTPHRHDPSLTFPESRVARATSIELSQIVRLLRRRPSRGVSPTGTGTGGPARSTLRGLLLYPDPQIGFYPAALAAGRRLTRQSDFDLVFSSSFPITAHLIGRAVARASRLPWVAEFRDPWSVAPPPRVHRDRAEQLERRLANDADAVVMTSPSWAAHLGRSWARPVDVVSNGCDPVSEIDRPPVRERVLAHVGSYYPGRQSLAALWAALAAMRRSDRPLPRLRWVGDLPAAARDELAAYGLQDAFEVTGFLPHAAAVREVLSASALFAGGPVDRGPIGRGWLPAKLFEYLSAGTPLIFVGDPTGDAAHLVSAHEGGYVVAGDDSTAAQTAITQALDHPRVARDVESLSRRARTQELARVFDRVV